MRDVRPREVACEMPQLSGSPGIQAYAWGSHAPRSPHPACCLQPPPPPSFPGTHSLAGYITSLSLSFLIFSHGNSPARLLGEWTEMVCVNASIQHLIHNKRSVNVTWKSNTLAAVAALQTHSYPVCIFLSLECLNVYSYKTSLLAVCQIIFYFVFLLVVSSAFCAFVHPHH